MKITEILVENSWPELNKNLQQFIEKNCKPWFSQLSDPYEQYVYRGVKRNINDVAVVQTLIHNRNPVDEKPIQMQVFNDIIKSYNKTANRNNSIFVTHSEKFAKLYGRLWVVLPIGNFNYTWSPNAKDWYTEVGPMFGLKNNPSPEQLKQNIEKIKNKITVKGDDNTLQEAIESNNEIMIHCNKVLYIQPNAYFTLFS